MLSNGSSLRVSAAVVACASAVGLSTLGIAAPALADAPAMTLTVSATGSGGSFGKNIQIDPSSTSPAGVGTYSGSVAGSNGTSSIWNCNYNFTGSSGADFANQSGSFSLTNSSNSALSFALTLAIPTQAMGPMTGRYNGSLSAALVTSAATGGVGSMSPVSGTPLWVASTAGQQINSLFNTWSGVSRSTPGVSFIGSQSFGGSQPSFPTGSFGSSLAMTFNFVLSAGATASFSTALSGVGVPVPAPGALAVLAVAGLGSRRRRR